MKIRLYFDEEAQDDDVVAALKMRGVDVLTTNEAGMNGKDDDEQLEYATNVGMVIYSFNIGHFKFLHETWITEGKSHTGIILSQQQRFGVGEQMRRLLKIVHTLTAEQMIDRLEFLGHWG